MSRGRPDERVILTIEGYKFKRVRKDRDDGDSIFVESPRGVCSHYKLSVVRELLSRLDKDAGLRDKFGLK